MAAGRSEAGQSLTEFLTSEVLGDTRPDTAAPDPEDADGFDAFLRRFVAALPVERAAVEHS